MIEYLYCQVDGYKPFCWEKINEYRFRLNRWSNKTEELRIATMKEF